MALSRTPLGELTALPQAPSWILGGEEGRRGKGGRRRGKEGGREREETERGREGKRGEGKREGGGERRERERREEGGTENALALSRTPLVELTALSQAPSWILGGEE